MVIKPNRQSYIELIADMLMMPIMYLLQFPSIESPQRTHFWNNSKYTVADISHLDSDMFISVAGDIEVHRRWLGPIPLFHMPIFGGWKKYVVLEPKVHQDQWFIGWIPGDLIGISHVTLVGPVRLLRSPQTAYFFGLNEHGEQIDLKLIGEGQIGKKSTFSRLPLL